VKLRSRLAVLHFIITVTITRCETCISHANNDDRNEKDDHDKQKLIFRAASIATQRKMGYLRKSMYV
jgi:hypothetical protein